MSPAFRSALMWRLTSRAHGQEPSGLCRTARQPLSHKRTSTLTKSVRGWVQVQREGKVLGQLLLGLKSMHQRAVIGRDATPGACDVVLEHASVSRRHAHLTADAAGGVSLTDLGSGNAPVTAVHCSPESKSRQHWACPDQAKQKWRGKEHYMAPVTLFGCTWKRAPMVGMQNLCPDLI